MEEMIVIDNLKFSYNDKLIFNGLNLKIKKGKWTTITGPNGSGKSTLIKILIGLLNYQGEIKIDNTILNLKTISEIRKKCNVVFENSNESFVSETVFDEISFVLENLNFSKEQIEQRILEISNLFELTDILQCNPYSLSNGEKQLVALASILVLKPKILLLDEALTKINNITREKILKILKKYHQEEKMTIINVTHDMEESIHGDDVVVINNGKIILNGKKELVYLEEKVFNKLGIELPFMVKLSSKLQYYNLLDGIIIDIDNMVDEIWK